MTSSSYPAHMFLGARLKVERAYTHFEDLNARCGEFWKRKPHRLVHGPDSEASQKHVRVRITEHPPAVWGTIVGDIIHNLRSALDLLATDLARANGHTSNTALKNTYFPISADLQVFESVGLDQIQRLSATDRAHICALQPYKGGNDLLWKLHRLDIMDKHTLLVPAMCALQNMNPKLFIPREGPPGVTRSAEMRLGHINKSPLKRAIFSSPTRQRSPRRA